MAPPLHHERRLQYRAETRHAILEEAERLLGERGSRGFSMRELASRCGCAAPTIYHYFRGKPALVAAVLEARLERLVGDLVALPRLDDPVATLRSRAAAFAQFGVRNPAHYQLLLDEEANESADSAVTRELRRLSTESLQDLVGRGNLPQRELEILRQGIWSLIHGFILLQTTRPDEEWEPQLLDRSLEAMIRGWPREHREPSAKRKRHPRRDARA